MNQKLLMSAFVAILVGTGVFAITFRSYQPQLFSLTDPNGTYTIVRAFVPGSSNRKLTLSEGDYFRLAYTGKKMLRNIDRGSGYVAVQIGKSPIALDPFVGRQVTVKGRFTHITQQCIQNQCISIGKSPMMGVEITEIRGK